MTEPASDKLIAAIEAVATNSFEISNASAFALVARIRQQDAEIERLKAAMDVCEADRKERVDQCSRMANDWADFCSSVGVTWDTQEAVASEINAKIERLRAALYDIIGVDHHNFNGEGSQTKIARAALKGGEA